MIPLILKALIFIVLLIIVIYHGGVAVDFVKGIVDWIVYSMKLITTGPPIG